MSQTENRFKPLQIFPSSQTPRRTLGPTSPPQSPTLNDLPVSSDDEGDVPLASLSQMLLQDGTVAATPSGGGSFIPPVTAIVSAHQLHIMAELC
ncbi:hypothetical protein DL93DRAFT_2087156 [Clavulina sp. PMI_390]|nr:hypothetical protein DL93DRAFT_2087156 [Clavulina sp. PMI_390]